MNTNDGWFDGGLNCIKTIQFIIKSEVCGIFLELNDAY